MEAEELIIKHVIRFLALAAMVTGCAHPLVPESVLADREPAVPSFRPAVIGAGGPVLGVNLYALHNYPAAQVETDGQRTLSYIRDVLHAGAVDIVWNFYASGDHSDTVDSTSATLSPANVAILTRIARRDHLLVEYRPVIVVKQGDPWEGFIAPAGPTRWFGSYYLHELPYLQDAQRYGVSEFIAATEMKALNGSPLWAGFFARIAQAYRGTISYAAHESDYFPPGTRLLPVRYVGVDMYRSLALPSSASQQQVSAAYASFFGRLPASVLRRTSIDETGIAARAGAYREPSFLGIPGTLDEAVQANWFTAACRTVQEYHLRAVFFWKVDLTDYPVTHPASSLSTFEGRQGAQAIAGCAGLLDG